MKHLWWKIILALLCIILLIPCIYIAHDRMLMPPPPPWVSPQFIPGQTWEQMANNYLSSHPDNSLKNYLNAFSMASVNSGDKAWRSVDTILRIGWTKDYPDVDNLMAFNQAALDEIMTGAEMKKCDLPPAPYDLRTPIPNFLRIQYLGKLMAVCGEKLEFQNKPKDALRFYLDGIQFGKDMGQKDQAFIEQLIGLSIISINIKPILHLVSKYPFHEQDYNNIVNQVNRIEPEQMTIKDMMNVNFRTYYAMFYQYPGDPDIRNLLYYSFYNTNY